jgi:hypothetical protein
MDGRGEDENPPILFLKNPLILPASFERVISRSLISRLFSALSPYYSKKESE